MQDLQERQAEKARSIAVYVKEQLKCMELGERLWVSERPVRVTSWRKCVIDHLISVRKWTKSP